MHRVLILGAGKIGALISGLLAESGSYKVNLGDVDGAAAQAVARATASESQAVQVDAARYRARWRGISRRIRPMPSFRACPTTATSVSPRWRARRGMHYFDLTEDVEVTRTVRRIAAGRERRPSCRSAASRRDSSASPRNELITHFDIAAHA